MIADKEAFIASVLASLNKQIPDARNPERAKQEIEDKRKKLFSKKERYQEMYANDLISMSELKDKLAGIAQELKSLDVNLTKIAQVQRFSGVASRL